MKVKELDSILLITHLVLISFSTFAGDGTEKCGCHVEAARLGR